MNAMLQSGLMKGTVDLKDDERHGDREDAIRESRDPLEAPPPR
jgi:hypothetical protein